MFFVEEGRKRKNPTGNNLEKIERYSSNTDNNTKDILEEIKSKLSKNSNLSLRSNNQINHFELITVEEVILNSHQSVQEDPYLDKKI